MVVKVLNKKYSLIIVLYCIVVFYSFASCTTKKKLPEAYIDLKQFVLDQNNTGYMYMLFFKTKEDQIGYIEAFNLQRNIYTSQKYNSINKETLFLDIINNEYLLKCGDLTGCFSPVINILSYFEQLSFDSFIERYAMATVNNNYVIDSKLTNEEQLTVIYCLYLSGVYTVWDDYSGFYIFSKEKPKLKKAEEIDLKLIEE